MSALRRIDKVCLPILLVSSIAAVLLGLFVIWMEDPPGTLGKCAASAVVLALSSGFVMSATRIVAESRKPGA